MSELIKLDALNLCGLLLVNYISIKWSKIRVCTSCLDPQPRAFQDHFLGLTPTGTS